MPVVQDARAGRRRRRFGAAAIAAIVVVTQAAAVVLAAPPGTSVTATKTTAGHLVRTFPWTLSKTVDPSELTLSSGESGEASYTVGATKGSAVQSAYFDGQICVKNTGAVATQGLAITDAISKPPSKAVLASVSVPVSAKPVLQPGEAFCYPYRVDLFSGVTPGATYKDTATVTISNKAGGRSGPAPSATAVLPTTVEVTNNDSITVADTNGSSITFSATGTASYDKTFTCPADAGSHANIVSATGFVSTPSVPAPAPATATVDVTCLEPDVTVSKDDGRSSATLGDTITYAVSVSNIGPGMAHGVTLSDSLPAGITWSIDNTTDFALSGSSLTLKNQPIDLAAGATLTVNVSGSVTQDVCETTLTNTASVSATNEAAGNTGNNSATDTTAISCVSLEVAKVADAETVTAGDPVGYTITVSNSGAGSASGVTMTDALPANGGLSWTVSPPDSDCSITSGTLTCDFGTIAAGGSASVHITSPTTPETCGTISNEATASTTSAAGTPTSGPVTVVVNCPDVTVEKTADVDSIGAGDTAAFTIVVSNSGAGVARGVTLGDSLPPGVTWSEDSPDCSISSDTLDCAFGDLAPGASRTIGVTGATSGASCGTLTNTTSISATNEAAADQGNNSDTASIAVACPNVTVTKTADADSISAGDEAAFTIVVSNAGSATARDVSLSDPLPAGISWSSDAGTIASGTLTYAIGDLAPGASATIKVTGTTDAADCGTLSNTATVSASNEDAAATADNSSTATITVNCPNVTVLKTADGSSITAGDTAAFTIVVSNTGAGTARSVTLTDTLPAGVSWTDDSADCDVTAGVLSCAFGDLAAGGSATVSVSGGTDADDCGILSNTAGVGATNEAAANEGDNSSTASITVNCAVIEISKVADATTVQAGDSIGFLITVTNTGDGTARDVVVSDTLPTDGGTSWSIDGGTGQAGCSIDAGVLGCAFGDLASGASLTVHITSPTTTGTCSDSPVDNLASVTTTNGGSTQASGSVTVRCNTAPVADNDAVSTAEDTPVIITLHASDADADPLTFAVQTLPATGTLEACSDSGCTTASAITTGVTLPSPYVRYTPPADANGDALASFTFTANDGFVDSNNATVTIDVTAVNDPPVVTTTVGSLAYWENDPAAAIDAGVTATDVDSATLTSATVQITTGCNSGQDVLALASPPAGITAGYTAATCTLALTGSASPADYQAALRAVTYANTSESPSTAARTVTFTVNDGTATGSATRGITVTTVNDAPANTVPGAQSVNEDTDLTFSGSLSVSDVDAGGGSIQTTVSAVNGAITPATGSGASITGSGTSSAVITGTLAQVNAALNGLKYKGTANFNSTRGTETLTIVTNDQGNTGSGGSMSDTDTVGITVNAVNDAPSAVAKNYNAQANMKIVGLSGLLTGATDPDTGDGGYTAVFTVGTVSATTPAGGTISNLDTANGTFDFDPPPGATGNVTFTFTVCDSGNPAPSACSAPATVTVSVAGPVIWFVNPAAGVNGDGRLSSPFNTLGGAAAVDASGDRIFVYTGTAASSITLNTNEWLIGQGVTGSTFDSLFSITPPAGTIARPSINGTRPTVQGNVVMASSDAVRGLNIQPGSGTAGLTASGATSLTVGEVSVTTVNATAVSLTNSDGTFSFTSVSASGGGNGIVWNNSSAATGSLTVNGDGSNTTLGGNASGGTISNMTGTDGTTAGIGIYLNNARNVTLRRMTVNGTNQNFGIRGTNVTNFTMEYSTVAGVNGTSTPNREGSVIFDNLFGSNAITSSIVSGAIEDNVRVENTTGTLTAFNLTNSTIRNNSTVSGNIGFRFATAMTGVTMTGTVSGSTFQGNRTIAIQADASNGTVNFTATNNTIIAGAGGNNQGNQGIEVGVANNGVMTFNVSGNRIGTDGITNQPLLNTGINIFNGTLVTSGTPALISGTVANNTVYNAGAGISGFGIRLFNQGYGTMNANVSNNTVNNVGLDYGIFAEVSSNSGTANATGSSSIGMTNNTSNVLAGGLDAIRLQARGRSTMCARISGNASTTTGTGFFGLTIRQASQTVSAVTYQALFNLEGLTAGLQTNYATIVTYLNSQNPAIVGGANEIHSTGITGVATNSCSSIP